MSLLDCSECYQNHHFKINATNNSEAPLLSEDDFAEIEAYANGENALVSA